jgi:ABC-type phosphate/phosphonate transport system permease subunit
MSPKRDRRRQARQEASRRSESRIQWLSVLLILAGMGMVYSGLYLAGVLPQGFFPQIQRFWEPTSTTLLVGTIGDLVAGVVVITLGALGLRNRLSKPRLYIIMACALVGLISDMLGGLYGIPAQVIWYLSLFTVLFRRQGG